MTDIGMSHADVGIILRDDASSILAAATGVSFEEGMSANEAAVRDLWLNLDQVNITDPNSADYAAAIAAVDSLRGDLGLAKLREQRRRTSGRSGASNNRPEPVGYE